jgi:hypothetical protein
MMEFGDPRLPTRFWAKVGQRGGCWIWTGAKSPANGGPYPQIRWKVGNRHKVVCAARLAVGIAGGGGGPTGAEVVRRECGRSLCVNPAHLAEATWADLGRSQTQCHRGHDLTLEGARRRDGRCVACDRKNQREYTATRRGAWRKEGLCSQCGREREDGRFLLCEHCREIGRRSNRRHRGAQVSEVARG